MRIVIFIWIGLFYCGCNNSEEYDFQGKVPESRLVLYAYAEADSLLYAEIKNIHGQYGNGFNMECEGPGVHERSVCGRIKTRWS